jgi:hypothetical protein
MGGTKKMNKEIAQEIAQTILSQLGGSGKLKMMIGASNFTCGDKGQLSFKFKKFRNEVVKEFNGVYNDQLIEIFEHFTGLTLSVPRVRGINCK